MYLSKSPKDRRRMEKVHYINKGHIKKIDKCTIMVYVCIFARRHTTHALCNIYKWAYLNGNLASCSYLWHPGPGSPVGTQPALVSRSPWSRWFLLPCHELRVTDVAVCTAEFTGKHSTPHAFILSPPPLLLRLPSFCTTTLHNRRN